MNIDIRNIHFEQLKRQGGIQAMGFDKDNCLTAPYVPHIHPPFEVSNVVYCRGLSINASI